MATPCALSYARRLYGSCRRTNPTEPCALAAWILTGVAFVTIFDCVRAAEYGMRPVLYGSKIGASRVRHGRRPMSEYKLVPIEIEDLAQLAQWQQQGEQQQGEGEQTTGLRRQGASTQDVAAPWPLTDQYGITAQHDVVRAAVQASPRNSNADPGAVITFPPLFPQLLDSQKETPSLIPLEMQQMAQPPPRYEMDVKATAGGSGGGNGGGSGGGGLMAATAMWPGLQQLSVSGLGSSGISGSRLGTATAASGGGDGSGGVLGSSSSGVISTLPSGGGSGFLGGALSSSLLGGGLGSGSLGRGSRWWRVLGGQDADTSRYRFIVSLRDANGRHFCGGSLVGPSVVLTAAHCLQNIKDGSVRYPTVHIGRYFTDDTDSQGYDVRRCTTSIVHPGWSFSKGRDDLSICILDSPSSKPTIPVASGALRLSGQTPLVVVGFGAKQEGSGNYNTLQEAVVFPQNMASCNNTYNGLIGTRQICAGRIQGGVDACQGDSGGPLLLPAGTSPSVFTDSASAAAAAPGGSETDLLLGVVSWGRGCGQKDQPGVYTDLTKYRAWVDRHLVANQLPTLAVTSFPSTKQVKAAVDAQYTCTTDLSLDVLTAMALMISNQGADLPSALGPYGCTDKHSPSPANVTNPASPISLAPAPSPPSPAVPAVLVDVGVTKRCPDGNGNCPKPAANPTPVPISAPP
ncbi:hypothetical protein Vafri_5296, partial [Volvox africanus]